MAEPVDVVVVGLGVAGEEVAGRLAEAGLSVVGVEGRLVGGECPYWGCVPSKMMVRSANLLAESRRVPGMAGQVEVRPDWAPVARRIRQDATDDWNDTVAVDRFLGKGGRFVRGWGRLAGPNRVIVGDDLIEARRGVVIGSGTAAAIPPIDGLPGTPYWTNREAIETETLPESLLVLGGGEVGVELAQVYARFGVAVTVIEAADRLLATQEPESSAVAAAALAADRIDIVTSAEVARVTHDAGRFTLTMTDGSTLSGQQLLVATGRRASLAELGVDTIGLDPAGDKINVDSWMRAGRRLWAVGDVTGRGEYTHVAFYQAGIAVRDILGQPGPAADYRAVPRVTFTDPEIGTVGLTEAQARDAGVAVRAGVAQVAATARGWIHKAGNEGFIKLVADADRNILVGATSACYAGGEVLGALAVAVHAQVSLDRLSHMIYAYPTFHRGLEDALRALR